MQEEKKIKTPIIAELAKLRKRVAKLERPRDDKKEKEALIHNENIFISLVEYSQDAIYILFRNKFEYINQKFSDLFQITLEEVNNPEFDFFSLVAPESLKIIEERINKIAMGESVKPKYEFTALTKGGERVEVEASVSYIPYKGDTAAHGILRDITERKKMEATLKMREKELSIKSHNLEEVNTALKVLLNRREEDSVEFEKRVVSNVQKLVLPYIKKLKNSGLTYDQITYTEIIESNLNEITSPFLRKLAAKYINFTPQEVQVANLIKDGKKNKIIAEILNVSERTIAFHRENIRKKLEITNKKTNLRSCLLTIS